MGVVFTLTNWFWNLKPFCDSRTYRVEINTNREIVVIYFVDTNTTYNREKLIQFVGILKKSEYKTNAVELDIFFDRLFLKLNHPQKCRLESAKCDYI